MQLNRRTLLCAAGVSLALPWLDASAPTPCSGQRSEDRRDGWCASARRWACTRRTVPGESRQGLRSHALSRNLQGAARRLHRDLRPVPSRGRLRHDSIFSFLTAAPHPERRAGFRNSISLDQLAAEKIGDQTRFPSLVLSAEGFSLSWTRSGALVPSETSPVPRVRAAVPGRPAGRSGGASPAAARWAEHSGPGRRDQANRMETGLGTRDRERLDEYFTSVRELEQRLEEGGGVVAQAQAEGRCQAAARHRQFGGFASARPGCCSTSRTWLCKPIPRGW